VSFFSLAQLYLRVVQYGAIISPVATGGNLKRRQKVSMRKIHDAK
jgi:hypothetical protein